MCANLGYKCHICVPHRCAGHRASVSVDEWQPVVCVCLWMSGNLG